MWQERDNRRWGGAEVRHEGPASCTGACAAKIHQGNQITPPVLHLQSVLFWLDIFSVKIVKIHWRKSWKFLTKIAVYLFYLDTKAECWVIYRGPCFFAVVLFGSSRPPPPPPPPPILPVSSTGDTIEDWEIETIWWLERGWRGWVRSRIIRPQESLVLHKSYKSFKLSGASLPHEFLNFFPFVHSVWHFWIQFSTDLGIDTVPDLIRFCIRSHITVALALEAPRKFLWENM